MAKGIEIQFRANVLDLIRGADSVEDALAKVESALDDVAKDGDKGTKKVEQGFSRMRREAQLAQREVDQTADATTRLGQTGRTIGDGVKQGTDKAGDAVREWGDEAKQNVAETVSSFRGEAGDFAQIAQDTFGGVISNLGPVGMAAGAAGAIGIGLIMGAFEKAKEEEQEFREQVAELAGTLIETGGDGADAVQAIADRLKELATSAEEGKANLAELHEDAASSASGFKRIADAYAGNTAELDKLISKEREQLEVLKLQKHNSGGYDTEYAAEIAQKIQGQNDLIDGLETASKVATEAEKAEAAYLASNGPAYAAKAAMIEAIDGELEDASDSWSDYYNAETKAADPAAFIENMQARITATSNFAGNVQLLAQNTGMSFEATQAVLEKGVDFAPMLAAIVAGGPEMQAQFAAVMQTTVDGGQAIIDGTPMEATITTKTDAQDAERQLKATTTERKAPVKAEADTTAAGAQLDAITTKKRTATIGASTDLSGAEAALSRFINRQRTATITAEVRTREGRLVP